MKKTVFAVLAILFYSVFCQSLSAQEKKLTIVLTNDLHSHLLGMSPNVDYSPMVTGNDSTLGGWARLSTAIKDVRKTSANPVLVVDSGDFTMGTLFHTVAREYSFELRLMKRMGYDAVTIGNHELDMKPDGLAQIIMSGHKKGGIPLIVASNFVFSPQRPEDDSLEKVFKAGLVKPYRIIEKGDVRIGVFGLLGKAATDISPFAAPLSFMDIVETAKEQVRMLREILKVDIVICLSHSGLNESSVLSEDETLAEEVDGIDVIVSGHSHDLLKEPLRINNTLIVQAGCFGHHMGVMDLGITGGNVKLLDYKLKKIDDTISGDPDIHRFINLYKSCVNMKFLMYEGTGFDNILAETKFDLLKGENRESSLGNLITDSMLWYVNKYHSDSSDPDSRVVACVECNGLIRDDIKKGKTGRISTADLFRSFPMGIGVDDTPCYSLVSFYVYAAEIRNALEVLASIAPAKGDDFFLQISGIRFSYNPNRMIFDRVTDIETGSHESGYSQLDTSSSNKKLYRVALNLYNATLMKMLGDMTFGILEIVPKDKNGTPINNIADARIDSNNKKKGLQELKEWVCLMKYVRSFKDSNFNGLPEIPEKYSAPEGRIIKTASWSPSQMLRNASSITWIGISINLMLFSLFCFVVWKMITFIRKK